jgi:beta-xylosidase
MLGTTLFLAAVTLQAPQTTEVSASRPAETTFTVHLPEVKMDWPEAAFWAEIERPDGKRTWAYATFVGQDTWTVPIKAEVAGRYRLLRVERRHGVRASEQSQTELTIQQGPRPDQKAAEKPLFEVGEFKTFFAAEEPWCVNDHTFVQGPDNRWHLFGITHEKPFDYNRDPATRLAHATAISLMQKPWHAEPPILKADWERYEEFLLWAPYVIKHEGTYYMFVCSGDKTSHHYRLELITSPDLATWTRSPANPIVIDGFDGRDPMVLRVGEQWVLYYTATSTPDGGNHIVVSLTSKDLVHWSNRKVVFTHPRVGTFGGPTESPFVVHRGDRYYLFVCDGDRTHVYLSLNPFHWDFENHVGQVEAHACEIVRDVDGQWYISHAGWTNGPLKIATLQWHDGLDDAPTNIAPGAK